jgi:hypothetical protein
MPPPGGPKEVYDLSNENYEISEGPEGALHASATETWLGPGSGGSWSRIIAARQR